MRSTGVSRRACALFLLILSLLAPDVLPRAAGQNKKSKRVEESYAIVAGTVFRDDGRAQTEAEVTVKPDPEDGSKARRKPVSVAVNSRGEFAVRVPATPMRYTVIVRAPGFRAQEKRAAISGDERVDVYFQLERDAPGK